MKEPRVEDKNKDQRKQTFAKSGERKRKPLAIEKVLRHFVGRKNIEEWTIKH